MSLRANVPYEHGYLKPATIEIATPGADHRVRNDQLLEKERRSLFGWIPNHKAQTLIEFALILPIFLLMLMLIFDLGRSVYAYSVIHNAAREGARSGIIKPYDQGKAIVVANHLTAGLGGVPTVIPSQTTDTFKVEVRYTFTAATPLLGQLLGSPGNTITLVAQSIMLKEK